MHSFSSLVLPSYIPKSQFENALGTAAVDPFSNVVFLGEQTTTRTEILETYQSGTYTNESLSAFLHEATHHRCFDSPLGGALLGIEGLSRAGWFETFKCKANDEPTKKECERNPFCFNRALAREILAIVGPLAEGLALYGELDAAPGESPAASSIAMNGLAVFYEKRYRELMDADAAFLEFSSWIRDQRMSPTFKRTRDLLTTDPEEEYKKDYVLGYRFVRRLIKTLHTYSPNARKDTDASLAFLCAYFFDDWALANHVLACAWGMSSHIEPFSTTAKVRDYLKTRVSEFCTPRIAEWYEQYISASVAGQSKQCDFLNYNPELEARVQMFANQAAATELYQQAPNYLQFRHLLRFGVLEADELRIDPDKHRLYCRIDDFSFELPALHGGLPCFAKEDELCAVGQETAIELIVCNYKPFICIYFKGSLIAVTDRRLSPVTESLAEQNFGNSSPYFHCEWWRKNYWELLNTGLETTCGRYLQTRLRHATSARDMIYKDLP
ncbi:MAG: hypothetical protein AAF711_13735 [Planctomycetota bacterium]